MSLLQHSTNRLLLEDQNYDKTLLSLEAKNLEQGLNHEQRNIYNVVLQVVYNKIGAVLFIMEAIGLAKHIYGGL